jgi:folate-binding protein YgfZ
MRTAMKVIGLEHPGIVRMRGTDAVKFLQGQLSNDMTRLGAERSLLAGYHNPQGRAIALLRLMQWDVDDIVALVPRELAPVVATRLSKFVLRAKVKIVDESAAWRVSGIIGDDRVPAGTADGGLTTELPAAVNAQIRANGAIYVCVGDQPLRWLVISTVDAPSPVQNLAIGDHSTWQQFDVATGQPQVYGATSEEFVAQMLNLDVLDAIAFDKGCYTGQEVIARAHYRGRVKRRMQRFVSREACRLSPGDSGQLADGRTFKVVEAAQLADGRCDFLAVAPLVGAGAEPAAPGATVSVTAILAADPQPLPYPLPD